MVRLKGILHALDRIINSNFNSTNGAIKSLYQRSQIYLFFNILYIVFFCILRLFCVDAPLLDLGLSPTTSTIY